MEGVRASRAKRGVRMCIFVKLSGEGWDGRKIAV